MYPTTVRQVPSAVVGRTAPGRYYIALLPINYAIGATRTRMESGLWLCSRLQLIGAIGQLEAIRAELRDALADTEARVATPSRAPRRSPRGGRATVGVVSSRSGAASAVMKAQRNIVGSSSGRRDDGHLNSYPELY